MMARNILAILLGMALIRNFGWIKGPGGMRRMKFREHQRVGWIFCMSAAVANLVPLVK